MASLREKIGAGMVFTSMALAITLITADEIVQYKHKQENPYKKQTINELRKSENRISRLENSFYYTDHSPEFKECLRVDIAKEEAKIDSIKNSKEYESYLESNKRIIPKNNKAGYSFIGLFAVLFYGGLFTLTSKKEED